MTFSKVYNPSKHLVNDRVIVLFKGRVVFRQYVPNIHKHFGIKMYKLSVSTGYMYDVKVYLGKDKRCKAQAMTATYATVTKLARKVEGLGHKLCLDNFFASLDLFNDVTWKKIYRCKTVRPNRKGMPQDLGHKKM
jgi:hypothetical protein